MNPRIPNNVLEALQSERDYQEHKWPDHYHSVGEWIMVMDRTLEKAKWAWLNGHRDSNEALEEIRQVTAVGIAAMQEHGALMRLTRPGPDAMIGQDDANSPVEKPDTRTAMDIDRERERAGEGTGRAPRAETPADQGAFGLAPQ